MDKPTNLNELIAYLQDHPRIWRENGTPWDFLYYTRGGLWFTDESHFAWYIQVSRDTTNTEAGLTFHDDRLEITKLGITYSYFYNKKDNV